VPPATVCRWFAHFIFILSSFFVCTICNCVCVCARVRVCVCVCVCTRDTTGDVVEFIVE
jgi:hypothetical protein